MPPSPPPRRPRGCVVDGTADRGLKHRKIGGARHRVVHEGCGQKLSIGVIDAAFHQGFAETLGNAAMRLALHDHRIYGPADVIDGGVARERDLPGFSIDLDLGDVAAIRKG